jgi:hypothetical protein
VINPSGAKPDVKTCAAPMIAITIHALGTKRNRSQNKRNAGEVSADLLPRLNQSIAMHCSKGCFWWLRGDHA